MEEEIECPKCDSSNVEEKKRKTAVGSGGSDFGWDLPEEEDYYFECLDCGCKFDESGKIMNRSKNHPRNHL
jgi:predicted nucleic-acid-binding Zn-ribbon protein